MTDQDRHAQFMVEAMKALVARADLNTRRWAGIAEDASELADAMLEAYQKRFALSPNAPSIGQVTPRVDRLVVALPSTDCWPEHLSAYGRAHGLPLLADAVRGLLLRGLAAWRGEGEP